MAVVVVVVVVVVPPSGSREGHEQKWPATLFFCFFAPIPSLRDTIHHFSSIKAKHFGMLACICMHACTWVFFFFFVDPPISHLQLFVTCLASRSRIEPSRRRSRSV